LLAAFLLPPVDTTSRSCAIADTLSRSRPTFASVFVPQFLLLLLIGVRVCVGGPPQGDLGVAWMSQSSTNGSAVSGMHDALSPSMANSKKSHGCHLRLFFAGLRTFEDICLLEDLELVTA